MPAARSQPGSGTSWLPGSAPMSGVHGTWRGWSIGHHFAAYGMYIDQGTQRGGRQHALSEWQMVMATRPAGGGSLQVRGMWSIEALAGKGAGYPLLLQTGGSYKRGFIHDRQHWHDLVMETAVMYARPIRRNLALFAYAAAVGEPALGPVAYIHRPSAANDPAAPLGHHWQDVSHVSYGVVTAGLDVHAFRLEGSAFNAREPDRRNPMGDFEGARLDSYAGRVSWAAARVAASAWWGYIAAHNALQSASQMHRYGASVMTQHRGIRGGGWATTAIWGMNLHHHGGASHAFLHGDPNASPHHHSSSLLAETNLGVGTRNDVFARAERVMKNGEELGFLGGDLTTLYEVRSVVLGYRRSLYEVGKIDVGAGARANLNFVPQTLELTYGTRRPKGFTIFAQLRPR
jgi:hypothetical protein